MPDRTRPSKAVILAAGKGTRLGHLTANLPKPLLEVAGIPILTHILNGLKGAGVREVCLVIGHFGEKIIERYGSGDAVELRLDYCWQNELNGTGSALMTAQNFCDSPFFMVFGDILLHPPKHYSQIAEQYAERQPDAVLAVNWVTDPCVGGAVYFDENLRVTRIVEKPPPGTSTTNYNQAGCFIFRPDIFAVLAALKPSTRGEIELTAGVNTLIEKERVVLAHQVGDGEWLDIGTPELLAQANQILNGER